MSEDRSTSHSDRIKRPESNKSYANKDVMPGSELWTDGLICAFEYIRGRRRSKTSKVNPKVASKEVSNGVSEPSSEFLDRSRVLEPSSIGEVQSDPFATSDDYRDGGIHPVQCHGADRFDNNGWVPIGWSRISELVKTVQIDADWPKELLDLGDDEDGITIADLAAPYWERPVGPVWWCHVDAGHSSIQNWLCNALWLHPAISLALRDEGRLISERMKHLLYEVPVRVAGGLLFELLGQSAGDPFVNEDDIPIVLRSWQAQNFLMTALHVKANISRINVLGISEVQELLSAGGYNTPRTVHEVIAQLACRLTRWDDRLFRKSIFGAADEIELKFMNRRNHEDLNLFSIILNQEIRRLTTQVIRVKWSLHARDEIIFELIQHLRGNIVRSLLEEIRKSSREMMSEQEAVRARLFTIQDVMQSTVRAWLQDKSLRITHNLAVFGGCGVVLTIITGLFGINVDGIPGAENTPYAFGLFTAILCVIGVILIVIGLLYFGLKKPISEEQVEVRKLELQELVKMFQHEAETHAQVRNNFHRSLPPTSGDRFPEDIDYVLIQ